MQDKYYGDKRDIVKWGGIVQLCRNRGIKNIVQVAFYRETPPGLMEFGEEEKSLPKEVVTHFWNIDDIRRLGDSLSMHIKVIKEPFKPDNRDQYICDVIKKIKDYNKPKVVFLDPDTGLEIDNPKDKENYVKKLEIIKIWENLNPKDFLVLYQHLPPFKKQEGMNKQKAKFASACGVTVNEINKWNAPDIANDVIFFYIEKK